MSVVTPTTEPPAIHWAVDADGTRVRASVLEVSHGNGRYRFRDLVNGICENTREWRPCASARDALRTFIAAKVRAITHCVRKRKLNEWTGQFALDSAQAAEAAAIAALRLLADEKGLDELERQAAIKAWMLPGAGAKP